MEIAVDISTAGYTLISSGVFTTIGTRPVKLDVLMDDERSVSVLLVFHPEPHPAGKRISHNVSDDRTVDEWHIYDPGDGAAANTTAPVPVLYYDDDCTPMALFLQLHTQRLQDGSVRVGYALWDGERDVPEDQDIF